MPGNNEDFYLTPEEFGMMLSALETYVIEYRCDATDSRYVLIKKLKYYLEPENERGQ